MYAEYLGGDNSCNGQAIEDVYECFPCLYVTSSFALVIEAVHWEMSEYHHMIEGAKQLTSCDIRTFMIATQEEEVLWVLYLVAQEQ